MKYERLKEHRQNEAKYIKLLLIFSLSSTSIFVISLFLMAFNILSSLVFAIITLVFSVSMALCAIFAKKADQYNYWQEEYIVLKVMQIINHNGIDSDDFEILCDHGIYKVAFHDQKVNYEDLQAKIDSELKVMNKIAKRSLRFKLI